MSYNLVTKYFGVENANAVVKITHPTLGTPAILANSTGGVIDTQGNATLSALGVLSVYVDTDIAWAYSRSEAQGQDRDEPTVRMTNDIIYRAPWTASGTGDFFRISGSTVTLQVSGVGSAVLQVTNTPDITASWADLATRSGAGSTEAVTSFAFGRVVVTGNAGTVSVSAAQSRIIAGNAAVGSAPVNPPLSVSGVDPGGLKRHLATDTSGNLLVVPVNTRSTTTATIAVSATTSNTVDLLGTAILGFIAPSGWTTAALNIDVSIDNITWRTAIYDSYNTLIASYASVVTNAAYSLDPAALLAFRYIRFRSSTAQLTTERVFTVITRPLA